MGCIPNHVSIKIDTVSTLISEIPSVETLNAESILQGNALDSEAIYILREVAAQFERPVLLFSGRCGVDCAKCPGFH